MRLGLNKLKSDGNAIADEETTTPPPPGRPAPPRRAPLADLLGIAALIEE